MVAVMNNGRCREVLAIIGWDPDTVAGKLGRNPRTCRRWASRNAVPRDIAVWLEDLAVCHLARPAPPKPVWDRRSLSGTASMSDDTTGRILAALERLEQGQTQLRTDLMARMDRLQHRMDRLDEHLTMGLGHADNAANQARSASEGSRILGEQLRSLEKLLLKLEARVTQLEERSHE